MISLDLLTRLRDVGAGTIPHLNRGGCPEQAHDTAGTLARDPACAACNLLDGVDAAIEHAERHAGAVPCPPAILRRGGAMTAPEVAALVGCDVKTIHNRAKAGKISAGETAGKHLRFRPRVVAVYLEAEGVPVPAWLEALVRGEAATS